MLQNKIKAAVIGATGFVGLDLVYLLTKHPKIKIEYLCAQKNIGKKISNFDKRIKKKLPVISRLSKVKWKSIDVIFLSLPNGSAQKIIHKLFFKYEHLKFIDLSADFRISNSKNYKKWYKLNHKAKKLINKSLYSIPEFTKDNINKFRIIANPGCYPTSIQLPLIPIIKKKLIKNKNIIIDSKSGYSGAGKNFKKKFPYKNLYSSIFAYGLPKHRHMSELDQEFLKLSKSKLYYTFNPHVIPTFRGLLSTIHLELKVNISYLRIYNEIKRYHKNNYFIKIMPLDKAIGTNNVINTNNNEISICRTRHKNKIVILSAIDNLIKGASGQAIQNMNMLYGLKQNVGLK